VGRRRAACRGEEAATKPILLSVGSAALPLVPVMAHESFENEANRRGF